MKEIDDASGGHDTTVSGVVKRLAGMRDCTTLVSFGLNSET